MNPSHSEMKTFMNKHLSASDMVYDVEFIKNPSPEYISFFFEELRKHKNYDQLKDDFIYDPDLNMFVHIINRFRSESLGDLSQNDYFYYFFMSRKEVDRILNIKNAEDYLLALRAQQVEENPRLKRVFSMLKKKHGARWSFSNYFETGLYRTYKKNLIAARRQECEKIPHGTIHSSEANGMCLKTPFGNIITLSYALRNYLYYMNVYFFGAKLGVDTSDTFRAFLLANRIMLGTESLDFELDPRGRLPKSIRREINQLTDWQMQFIIGHEFAHHYLGHLKTGYKLKSIHKISKIKGSVPAYTYDHLNEFQADLHAIQETTYQNSSKTILFDGAIYFFISLYMQEQIEQYLFPKISGLTTHPDPIERIWNLRKNLPEAIGMTKDEISKTLNYFETLINQFLKEFLPYHVETMENTGSVYLETYKKKKLIDRLDF